MHDAYLKRKYESYTKYWPDFDWPPFDDLDAGFRASKDEWGSIEFLEHGLRLSLDPLCQRYPSLAKPTLFHEMGHIVMGPRYGHGRKFNLELLGALNRGAIHEGII